MAGDVDELMAKYREKLAQELGASVQARKGVISKDYQEFRKESLPGHMTFYEKACNWAGGFLKMKLGEKKKAELAEYIRISHLQTTPEGTFAFSILGPVSFMLLGMIISLLLFNSLFFVMVSLLLGLIFMGILAKWPAFLANAWRMKASNQMVLCVFYVVTYMRHTSNLELAIRFAGEHLSPPLSTDLKKVVYDVETQRYDTIQEALDKYLESWRQYNKEFIEAFHLIESSLLEGDQARRQQLLDKSLDVILNETYEKMLNYAHNLKSPITTLHMMGVILPVLGLVILPLVVSFLEGVAWYHIAVLYNVFLPLAVYTLAKNILSTRPTGYGDTDVTVSNPELKEHQGLKLGPLRLSAKAIGISVFCIFFLLGLSPLLIHLIAPEFDIPLGPFKLLEYRESSKEAGVIIGPYGMGATILSLCFPLAFALGLGLYYRLRASNVIDIRAKTKQLEDEFASALFQLGNRLGDGMPAEAAFGRVGESMEDTVSGQFFNLVSTNIKKLGMGLNEAIFNPRTGAIRYFPSNLIESSMKVLLESIKKGPTIAAQALQNVSRYVKEIHQVNERLKDLMADIISDMKSQIKFLAPVISAIVIGITSMITTILGALAGNIDQLQEEGTGGGRVSGIASLFGDGIPTYYFQLVVGIYIVQIIYILTIMSNGVENGVDELGEQYELGQNLIRSTLLYCFIALTVMIIFNFIAAQILTGVTG